MEEPDGLGHWSLTTKMPLRDENGAIVGTFGMSHDITDLVRARQASEAAKNEAEKDLRTLNEELERRVEERTSALAREKYVIDTFMENVPDSIYFKDRDSRITRANKAHATRLGFSDPAEEIGKSDFDFFPED